MAVLLKGAFGGCGSVVVKFGCMCKKNTAAAAIVFQGFLRLAQACCQKNAKNKAELC